MTVTIPTKLTNGRKIYEFQPSSVQKIALSKARKNRKNGKVLTLGELN